MTEHGWDQFVLACVLTLGFTTFGMPMVDTPHVRTDWLTKMAVFGIAYLKWAQESIPDLDFEDDDYEQ